VVAFVLAALALAGCSGHDGGATPATAPSGTPDASDPASSPSPSTPLSPLGSLVQPAGDANYDADEHRSLPSPAALSIDAIGLDGAPVVPVGLNAEGALDVPGAREVGWYRFGPSPGDRGSAVLAAHIAFNGRDGVFRNLDRLEPGGRVLLAFDDGSAKEFVVSRREQYDKDSLPDDLFISGGESRLVLITCGGAFNPNLRRYEDNIVVYADPV
jgi:hypothetical protein